MTDLLNLKAERSWPYPPRPCDQIVLVSGDDFYLRRYLGSAAASILLAGMRLHVNAIGPSHDTMATLERMVRRFPLAVSLSVETTQLEGEEARAYFAASRFLCARELVVRFRCSLFMLDVDVVVLRPFVFPDADYGIFLRAVDDPRFEVNAGAVFVAPRGLAFLDAFATHFADCRPWSWFDDQKCLAQAHQETRARGLRAVRLTNRFLGFEPLPQLAVWSAKGRSKTDDVRFVQINKRLSETLWHAVGGGPHEHPAPRGHPTIEERNAPAMALRKALRSEQRPPLALQPLLAMPSFVGFAKVRLSETIRFEMLLCDRDDGVALRAFWNGVYEPATSAIVTVFARASQCVIDVGAHTGYFSMLAATANPEAAVIAIEPSSLNCARFMTNVRANGLTNIRLAAYAASDRSGTATLVSNAPSGYHSTGGSLVGAAASGETVSTIRLDDLVASGLPAVGLIKCDVEGHEAAALLGGGAVIERDRPSLIVECNDTERLKELTWALRSLGYGFFVIDEVANRLERAAGLVADRVRRGDPESRRNRLVTTMGEEELRALLAGQITVE